MSFRTSLRFSALMLVMSATPALASSITCPWGTPDRQASFSNAIDCKTMGPVTGTPKVGDVEALFGGSWFEAGHLSMQSGTDDWLTGNVTSGSWGTLPVAGTWKIGEGFWDLYPRAVISFHLGNGGGDPDWFFFEIGPGATDGVFSINQLNGSGGGLSNMTLWADPVSDTVQTQSAVPEPASLALLGTGLFISALALRKRRVTVRESSAPERTTEQ